MNEFDFLKVYIARLPEEKRNDLYFGYVLREGKSEIEISRLESEAGILVPDELKNFYKFSYGALLSEYEMLTITEIAKLLPEMRWTYEEDWRDSVLPFAYVRGVGDVVAFDLSKINEGNLLILDGFHELPPEQWKRICYGLRTWLDKMVENDFHPFWLRE